MYRLANLPRKNDYAARCKPYVFELVTTYTLSGGCQKQSKLFLSDG